MSDSKPNSQRKFAIRYAIEAHDGPADSVQNVAPGINVSDTEWGFADDIFVASVLRENGKISSILLFGSNDGEPVMGEDIPRELLLAIYEQVGHHLKCHTSNCL